MAQSPRDAASALPEVSVDPFGALMGTVFESIANVQRLQLDALLAWQASFAAVAQEFADEWACRFGGGVPIDG